MGSLHRSGTDSPILSSLPISNVFIMAFIIIRIPFPDGSAQIVIQDKEETHKDSHKQCNLFFINSQFFTMPAFL